MLEFFKHVVELVGQIGVLATAALAVWSVTKKPWVAVRAWLKKTDDAIAKVSVMSAALGPNGGSSLYDKITATEARSQISGVRIDWLFDQFDRPIFEFAPDGTNVRINAAFANQFGYAPADMLGQKWVGMIHPEDRERVMTEWEHALADQRMFESQYRAVTRNRALTMVVRVIAEPQPHPKTGEILRWLGRVEIVKTGASA